MISIDVISYLKHNTMMENEMATEDRGHFWKEIEKKTFTEKYHARNINSLSTNSKTLY